jgi:DNA-binding response OmpR family regulator
MSNLILVVEDEKSISDILKLNLEKNGFRVSTAYDGEDAVNKALNENPDLILLDVMLPKLDGFSVCKKIRETLSTPIIMLTAREEEVDKVLGLELGADDYMTKPFSLRELMARVKAVLKRGNAAQEKNLKEKIDFEGLSIDMSGREVYVNGERASMTPKEYDLLFYLVKNKNIALSRDKLLEEVWGYDFFGDDRTVDTHIKMLRNSLGEYRKFIVTLRGMGYKFEAL